LPDDRHQERGRPVTVRWGLSAHARRLLTLAVAGLIVAVLTGRAQFAGLAAPPLLLLATWRAWRPAAIRLRIDSSGLYPVEGDQVPIRAGLSGHGGYNAEVRLAPAAYITSGPAATVPASRGPAGTGPADGGAAALALPLEFRPERWGRRRVGAVDIVLRDYARLTEGRAAHELPRVDCAPRPARLDSMILLSRLPSRLGEHSSRAAGEGSEFAGVREFVPGDRQRRINWPATTRRGTLHLSTFAAERTMNVVVIADCTADVGEPGLTSLDLVQRGAAGVLTRYLASRDRVGLVRFGRQFGWIGPGQGRRHYRRLLNLLVAGADLDEGPAVMTRLPRAALPPGALIIVFSALIDPRMIEAVRDLRERGFSVLVVDVLNAVPRHDHSTVSQLARRLWQLEQQAIRFSLTEIGVPVAHWDGRSSLDEPLAPYTRRPIVVRH
jgi:uncharacterized protein (DUF58 family)